ncbi:MAG: AraC family transcriptional regulator [Spirochaetaceae bacterium]|nr:AraC family transcriptional regulator [Spirochaetaceae bacterium]
MTASQELAHYMEDYEKKKGILRTFALSSVLPSESPEKNEGRPQNLFISKLMTGDESNLNGSRYRRIRVALPPSRQIKRSCLYLQMLGAWNCLSSHYTRRSNLESYLICQTVAGEGRLEYGGKTYSLKPGTGFFIDCRKPQYYYAASKEGWAYNYIHLDGFSLPDYYESFSSGGNVTFTLPDTAAFNRLFDELDTANRESDFKAGIHTSRILDDMLWQVFQNASLDDYDAEMPPKIREVRAYLNSHFIEDISLDSLSARFAVSKYHLCRQFEKFVGKSPIEYLNTERLKTAKTLLSATDMTMEAIAYEVGFNEPLPFYRMFKKYEHITPGEYRAQNG